MEERCKPVRTWTSRSGKPGVMEVILSHNVAQVEGHVAGPKAHAYESEETTVILVPEVAAGEELPIAAQAARR